MKKASNEKMNNKFKGLFLRKLLTKLEILQNYCRDGLHSIEYVISFYVHFEKFFDDAHIFLKLYGMDRDSFFLKAMQIVSCVKNVEKTLKAEEEHTLNLERSRQILLKRIKFYLLKLEGNLSEIPKNHDRDGLFKGWLEMIFDEINCLMPFLTNNVLHPFWLEAPETSKKIKGIVYKIMDRVQVLVNISNVITHKRALQELCFRMQSAAVAFNIYCEAEVVDQDRRYSRAWKLQKTINDVLIYLENNLTSLICDVLVCFRKYHWKKSPKNNANEKKTFLKKSKNHLDRMIDVAYLVIAFIKDPRTEILMKHSLCSLKWSNTVIGTSQEVFGYQTRIFRENSKEARNTIKMILQNFMDKTKFCEGYLNNLVNALYMGKLSCDQAEDILWKGEIFLDIFREMPYNKHLHTIKVTLEKYNLNPNEISEDLPILITSLNSFYRTFSPPSIENIPVDFHFPSSENATPPSRIERKRNRLTDEEIVVRRKRNYKKSLSIQQKMFKKMIAGKTKKMFKNIQVSNLDILKKYC